MGLRVEIGAGMPMSFAMSTVLEIEDAVEKLSPEQAKEFAEWYARRQALVNAAEATFLAYDEEESRSA